MIYGAYQAAVDATLPLRLLSSYGEKLFNLWEPCSFGPPIERLAAYCEVGVMAGYTHVRPEFEIDFIQTRAGVHEVEESVAMSTPFSDLRKFAKRGSSGEPKVLLIAPMSGHFATLLRNTARTLLRDHEVYVTDWRNTRDVPLSAGKFDLDAFVQHVIDFIQHMGAGAHVVAVCQPTVAALAACAVMAAEKDPCQPASLTLMAGPIDPRVNPTKVNDLANGKPIEWFRDNLIGVVPERLVGGGRRVYPGFLQISAFMSMNMERLALLLAGPLNQPSEASNAWKMAYDTAPDDPRSGLRLEAAARTMTEAGHPDDAYAMWDKVARHDPDRKAAVKLAQAQILLSKSRLGQAQQHFKAAVEAGDDSPLADLAQEGKVAVEDRMERLKSTMIEFESRDIPLELKKRIEAAEKKPAAHEIEENPTEPEAAAPPP